MFQRFTVVMEYQQKPVLPPPIIAFCHIYSLMKYFIRKAKGIYFFFKRKNEFNLNIIKFTFYFILFFTKIGLEGPRDNGLKLFLERDDLERLYDFEEECVEGYFREQVK